MNIPENLDTYALYEIASVIKKDWVDKQGKPNINYAAKPYVEAMGLLTKIDEMYYQDSGRDIVARFLCNANSWRGEVAKEVKLELKKRLKNS